MNNQTNNNSNGEYKKALQHLTQLQEELTQRLENLSADRSSSHSIDSSEQAVERENDEVVDQLENDTREELVQVQSAIKRIENGTYGICAKCEEEISPQRLQAIPYATLCIHCADA
ncbi:TraR/DksA family transcriptional regulator [Cocleimonas flava]|uniref:TraR/DksA family transcriptional regulator n=1 Tax=Cocleimonas flava TaxID=634765 RepID=A0A4R1F3C8_9GAMM|nr:TraR/DksA family transcriptional regulator [Cocleimonas flava]TCJ88736.1 TraR/DksA family transcriptional regulator [Cocleimonas flava]